MPSIYYLTFIIATYFLYIGNVAFSILILFILLAFLLTKRQFLWVLLLSFSFLAIYFFHFKAIKIVENTGKLKFVSTSELKITGFLQKRKDNKFQIQAFPYVLIIENPPLLYRSQKVVSYGFAISNIIIVKELDIKDRGNFLLRFLSILREKVLGIIENIEDPTFRNLSYCFIAGNKSFLDYETKENFRITGLLHLLALSGLHITIIAGFVSLLVGMFFSKRISFYIASTVVLLYVVISGMNPSVMRAGLMYLLYYYFSKIKGLKVEFLDIILLTAFISVILAPESLFNPAFWLSYSSFLGIFFFKKPLENLFLPFPSILRNSFSITLGANLATLPIQLIYFKSISLISLISNLLIIPLFSIFIVTLFLSFLFFLITPVLSNLIFSSLSLPLWKLCRSIADFLSKIPANVEMENFSRINLITIYLLIVLIFFFLPALKFRLDFMLLDKFLQKKNKK